MKFKVKETGEIKTVELKLLHNEYHGGQFLEESKGVTGTDEFEYDSNKGYYIVSQAELDAFIDGWQDEVNKANADPYGYYGDKPIEWRGGLAPLMGTRVGFEPSDFTGFDPDPDEWELVVGREDDDPPPITKDYYELYDEVVDLIKNFRERHWSQLVGNCFGGSVVVMRPRYPGIYISPSEVQPYWSNRYECIETFTNVWGWYLHKITGFSGVRFFADDLSYNPDIYRGVAFLGVSPEDTPAVTLMQYITDCTERYCIPDAAPFLWADEEDAIKFFSGALLHLGWEEGKEPEARKELLKRLKKIYREIYIYAEQI